MKRLTYTAPLLVTTAGGNSKLGPCVASTSRQVGPTCPSDCPLLNNGCYAQRGRMAYHSSNVLSYGSHDEDDPLSKADGAPLIRHLAAGGWCKPTADDRRVVDRDFLRYVINWHRRPSQRYTIGWGYTHAAGKIDAAGLGPEAWPEGLEILASCHTEEEAKAHQARGWRTARVIDEPEDKTADEVLCPFDLAKRRGVKNTDNPTTCASCRLCMPGETKNIAFLKF